MLRGSALRIALAATLSGCGTRPGTKTKTLRLPAPQSPPPATETALASAASPARPTPRLAWQLPRAASAFARRTLFPPTAVAEFDIPERANPSPPHSRLSRPIKDQAQDRGCQYH